MHACLRGPAALAVASIAWLLAAASARAEDFPLASPSGNINVTLSSNGGALTYSVKSEGTQVLQASPLGIVTDKGDFSAGTTVTAGAPRDVDETYTLPQGKRSTYVNRAKEITVTLSKGGAAAQVVFRAYDDGIAFRYVLQGTGNVSVTKETSGFNLASADLTVWGQAHPNNYGYESILGKVPGDAISMPAMIEAKALNHWFFLANAADFSTYAICHFARAGGLFTVQFPMDQGGPITGTMPLTTSWHFALISPKDPSKIVESVMPENLNPPTEPDLASADWIKSGRASWDYLGGEKNTVTPWVDFDAGMGWEYHIMDAGFEGRIGDVKAAVATAAAKGISLGGWAYSPDMSTRDKAQAKFDKYAGYGLKEIKIDFFDHNPFTGNAKTNDFEDTQASLAIRDYISEIAAQKHMHVEFHGCAIPSGERRRWPHLMTYEAIHGMESHPPIAHECTIPFTRNVMGAVDYTLVDSKTTTKSPAEEAGTAVVFESGIQVYAAPHAKLATHPALEFFKAAPSNWDDTRFVEGYPESHATIARRKGGAWFVGSITAAARTAVIPLSFLVPGHNYDADIFHDGADNTKLVREHRTVTSKDTLRIPCNAQGGLGIRLSSPEVSFIAPPLRGRAPLPQAFTAHGRDILLPPGAARLSVFGLDGRLLGDLTTGGATRLPGSEAVRVLRIEPAK